jgi:hypothetical protein
MEDAATAEISRTFWQWLLMCQDTSLLPVIYPLAEVRAKQQHKTSYGAEIMVLSDQIGSLVSVNLKNFNVTGLQQYVSCDYEH